MEIYDTNSAFDFQTIILTKPTISGGVYFIKFLIGNQPLYIQPPKTRTRQGIIKAGKRLYCDLMFTNENEEFVQWMENLENYCQQAIYKNREKWFDGDMELHDIENYFTSTLKIFKSGKFYVIRTNIATALGKPILKIYDEDEQEVTFETIVDNTNVVTILEIQGIKCSSKSFQIEIEMKQMMVLRPVDIFEKCIIAPSSNKRLSDTVSTSFESALPRSAEKNDAPGVLSQEPLEIEEALLIDSPIVLLDEPSLEPEEAVTLPDEPVSVKLSEEPNAAESVQHDVEREIRRDTGEYDTSNTLEEIEFHLDEIEDTQPILIKERNNIYYDMYKEAKRKARIARDLALSAYLEAKRIKNTYMLNDVDDDDDDEYEEAGEDDDEDEEEEKEGGEHP